MLLAGLFAVLVLAFLNAVPVTFFTMLFLGNLGVNLGFWALLPGAMALNILKNSVFTVPVVKTK